MILNTGNRTDIPAFYTSWFLNRLKEGYVYVRNPYNPHLILHYDINPQVIDFIIFGTKNPIYMLKHLDKLKDYRTLWHITLTAYGKDIEPYLINKNRIVEAIIHLSQIYGDKRVLWRYDPILLNEKYTKEYHYQIFEKLCYKLQGSIRTCIISFVDLYHKTKINFPECVEVNMNDRLEMVQRLSSIALKYHINIKTCLENEDFYKPYADVSGCLTQSMLEDAFSIRLEVQESMKTRPGYSCLLGYDIGEYSTCLHGCKYCYANEGYQKVLENYKKHDPYAPLLIGHITNEDKIIKVKQKTIINHQMNLFDFLT